MNFILPRRLLLLLMIIPLMPSAPTLAGQVVVRSADEPFDAFALRDELARQHEWQEAMRAQQQLEILQRLPLGCLLQPTPYRHFNCSGLFYRPYPWRGKEVYIQVPEPAAPAIRQSDDAATHR